MPDRERERPAMTTAEGAPTQRAAFPDAAHTGKVGLGGVPRLVSIVLAVAMCVTGTLQAANAVHHGGSWLGWLCCASAALALAVFVMHSYNCFSDTRFSVVLTEEGIVSPSLAKRRRRAVSWDRVGSCRVIREHRRGLLGPAWYVVLDTEGQELVRVNVTGMSDDERGQLVRLIRERQGTSRARSELFAAGPPGGIGTELEAAQAPAGRGTEPEAVRTPGEHGRE